MPLHETPGGTRMQMRLPDTEWAPLQKVVAAYRDLEARMRAARVRLGSLEGTERERAEQKDRRAYVKEIREGNDDHPGTPETDKVDREIKQCRDLIAALDVALDEAETDLVAVVDEHRQAWLEEIEAQVEKQRKTYAKAIESVASERGALDVSFALLRWTRDFPEVGSYRPQSGYVRALVAPHGDPFYFAEVVQALREDANPPEPVEKVRHPITGQWPTMGVAS